LLQLLQAGRASRLALLLNTMENHHQHLSLPWTAAAAVSKTLHHLHSHCTASAAAAASSAAESGPMLLTDAATSSPSVHSVSASSASSSSSNSSSSSSSSAADTVTEASQWHTVAGFRQKLQSTEHQPPFAVLFTRAYSTQHNRTTHIMNTDINEVFDCHIFPHLWCLL
jgi:hypothetical protein